MSSTGVIYITVDDERVPAWTCGCGADPKDQQVVVKFDEPRYGLHYMVCHADCIRPA